MHFLALNGLLLMWFIMTVLEIRAHYYGEDQHIVDGLVQRRIKDRRRGRYYFRYKLCLHLEAIAKGRINHQRMETGHMNWRYQGEYCESSDDCHPGLCCVQRAYRTCQPLSWYGQRCGYGQIKGGCYWRHCPCVYGEDYCQQGYCQV
uniref:Putative ixodegrins large 4 n=1 Tax=Amblyomma triste TaxID=251400 RepID=A0A023GCB4_AMBTT